MNYLMDGLAPMDKRPDAIVDRGDSGGKHVGNAPTPNTEPRPRGITATQVPQELKRITVALAAIKQESQERESRVDGKSERLEKLRRKISRIEEKEDPSDKEIEELPRMEREVQMLERREEQLFQKYHAATAQLISRLNDLAAQTLAVSHPLTEATIAKFVKLLTPLQPDSYQAGQMVRETPAYRNWMSVLVAARHATTVPLRVQALEQALVVIARAHERGAENAF